MKYVFLFLALILSGFVCDAQKTSPASSKSKTVRVKDEMPAYPGGEQAMIKYISDNLKFPDSARTKKIEGKVLVSYTIDEYGQVTDVYVVKGIGGGCDEEAMRVIKSMPKWKPGNQGGEGIRVQYTIPINFQLPRRRLEPVKN